MRDFKHGVRVPECLFLGYFNEIKDTTEMLKGGY